MLSRRQLSAFAHLHIGSLLPTILSRITSIEIRFGQCVRPSLSSSSPGPIFPSPPLVPQIQLCFFPPGQWCATILPPAALHLAFMSPLPQYMYRLVCKSGQSSTVPSTSAKYFPPRLGAYVVLSIRSRIGTTWQTVTRHYFPLPRGTNADLCKGEREGRERAAPLRPAVGNISKQAITR